MKWIVIFIVVLPLAGMLYFLLRPDSVPTEVSLSINPPPSPRIAAQLETAVAQAKLAAQHGEHLEGIRILQEARKLDRFHPLTYVDAGEIYWNAGIKEGALREWEEGIRQCGETPNLLLALGRYHLIQNNQPERALQYLEKAERKAAELPGLKDALAECFALKCSALLKSGEENAAAKAAETALRYQSDNLRALEVRAQVAERESRWTDAVLDWESVFEKKPTVGTRHALASVHKKAGYAALTRHDRAKAMSHFRRTVELDSTGVALDAILDLLTQEAQTEFQSGVEKFQNEDFQEAERHFRESLRYISDNPLAFNHLGLCLLKRGAKEEAAQAWEDAIGVASKTGFGLGSTPTHKNLAILYRDLGRKEDASRVARDYLEKYPNGAYREELEMLDVPGG